MVYEHSLGSIVGKLESLFSSFNDYFYNNELQRPVITISPNNRKVNCLGWCTSWKAWNKNSGQEKCTMDDDSNSCYEINICAEYLNEPFEKICSTLLHEMAHLYNLQSGIQDTCRSGLYHNKQFKRIAEEHGLVVSKDMTYGFSITHLNKKASRYVASLKGKNFQLYREKKQKASTAKRKNSTRKYVCPRCGLIIRATREAHVLCMACSVELKQEY